MNAKNRANIIPILILFLLLLTLTTMVAFAAPVIAASNDNGMTLKAERNDTILKLHAVPEEQVTFGGLQFVYSFDDSLLNNLTGNRDVESPIGGAIGNYTTTNRVTIDTGYPVTINGGDPIFTLNFRTDDFQPDVEYVFSVTFESAFNDVFEYYPWTKDTVTTTYAEYTVKFEAPDADAPVDATQYVVRGQSATAPDDPQRAGFEFDGWEVSKGNAASVTDAIMEPTTFTAKWKKAAARTATVTWVDGNGKTLKTDTVEHGVTPVYDGDTPTKTDPANQYTYRFNGSWDPAVAPVSGDVTYTAQFDQVQTGYHIYVKDHTNGGAVTSLDPNAYYSGTVDFTVDAGQATVLAQVVDGTAETVNSTDGTYERLYGTEMDGSHHFSVTMPGDRDLYLIMGYKGDCDYNGEVDLKDATNISQIYVETQTANALQRLLGDADGNGELTLKDSTRIAWHYTDHEPLKWDQRES